MIIRARCLSRVYTTGRDGAGVGRSRGGRKELPLSSMSLLFTQMDNWEEVTGSCGSRHFLLWDKLEGEGPRLSLCLRDWQLWLWVSLVSVGSRQLREGLLQDDLATHPLLVQSASEAVAMGTCGLMGSSATPRTQSPRTSAQNSEWAWTHRSSKPSGAELVLAFPAPREWGTEASSGSSPAHPPAAANKSTLGR